VTPDVALDGAIARVQAARHAEELFGPAGGAAARRAAQRTYHRLYGPRTFRPFHLPGGTTGP
jgi:hypothetical protein